MGQRLQRFAAARWRSLAPPRLRPRSPSPLLPRLAQPVQATQLGQPQQRITPEFQGRGPRADRRSGAAATRKTFIIDPRVRAQVTMLLLDAVSPEGFYQTFSSRSSPVHDFIAVPGGNGSSRSFRTPISAANALDRSAGPCQRHLR